MRNKNLLDSTKSIWQMNATGNLTFDTSNSVTKFKYMLEDIFENPIVCYFIMLLLAISDLGIFYNILSSCLYDVPIIRIIAVAGFLFGMDFVPIAFGRKLKEYQQGYNVDKLGLIGSGSIFVFTIIAAFAISIGTMEFALVSDEAKIIISLLLPSLTVITSVGSLFVSFMLNDPMKKELQKLEKIHNYMEQVINQNKALLEEYQADDDFLNRIIKQDEERYMAALECNAEHAKLCGDYVRQKIKEHIGEAAATNYLSKEKYDELMKKYLKSIETMSFENNESVILPFNRKNA